ncbi:hypothetical protein K438DRAFT_1787203 [Mycena galopus ATCC 62051]|nr:hypothetical protein K438DRAFT_1787203 [Mycena galopus ATCC 62051]
MRFTSSTLAALGLFSSLSSAVLGQSELQARDGGNGNDGYGHNTLNFWSRRTCPASHSSSRKVACEAAAVTHTSASLALASTQSVFAASRINIAAETMTSMEAIQVVMEESSVTVPTKELIMARTETKTTGVGESAIATRIKAEMKERERAAREEIKAEDTGKARERDTEVDTTDIPLLFHPNGQQ